MVTTTQSCPFSVSLTSMPSTPTCYEATVATPTGKETVWDIVKRVFETLPPFSTYDVTKDITGVTV